MGTCNKNSNENKNTLHDFLKKREKKRNIIKKIYEEDILFFNKHNINITSVN